LPGEFHASGTSNRVGLREICHGRDYLTAGSWARDYPRAGALRKANLYRCSAQILRNLRRNIGGSDAPGNPPAGYKWLLVTAPGYGSIVSFGGLVCHVRRQAPAFPLG
jgi:hypothetical protein